MQKCNKSVQIKPIDNLKLNGENNFTKIREKTGFFIFHIYFFIRVIKFLTRAIRKGQDDTNWIARSQSMFLTDNKVVYINKLKNSKTDFLEMGNIFSKVIVYKINLKSSNFTPHSSGNHKEVETRAV